MTLRRVTVAGAGLAGLSAATVLREAGVEVAISDSATQAGGRCRSYHDPRLGRIIDNGNHLVLSGNPAVADFRSRIGATPPLAGPSHADFIFVDLAKQKRWTVGVNDGRLPWWVLSARRRVPDTRPTDYSQLAMLMRGPDKEIREVVTPAGTLWNRLIDPVLLAMLNTPPAEASAKLAASLLRETFGLGGLAMRPRIAEPTLAAAFIDPAISWLSARGSRLTTGRRLKGLSLGDDRVTALLWSNGQQDIGPDETVILALPPWVTGDLVPGLIVPNRHHAIVNGHFVHAVGPDAPRMLGLIGGTAQWVFVHDDRISVTVSAADDLLGRDREELARTLWGEVSLALGLSVPLPSWQIVSEKRATFAATPEQDARRPGPRTAWRNLFLAGDWISNGLPATIEGALRSGHDAASLAMGMRLRYGRTRC